MSDTPAFLDPGRPDVPNVVVPRGVTPFYLPDRPGNNRVDSFQNLLANPHVGLIFFVPGVDETLRVNGTASIFTDPDLLAGSEVLGRLPKTGLLIRVEEVFFHCAKALIRSKLWLPEAWRDTPAIDAGSFLEVMA